MDWWRAASKMENLIPLARPKKTDKKKTHKLVGGRSSERILACAIYLQDLGGTQQRAAELFNVERTTIWRWMQALKGD
jgi:hypothetical protein